ncbi:MAG: quinone-dependent dihydroorotate dehydrogenase [Fimbriimonadaceae bacterium]
MGLYTAVMRPLAFQFDPERVHEAAMACIRRGWVRARPYEHPALTQTWFGVTFPNPLGLAAGFDKNAVALDRWHTLGFGFVEAGTVTYLPQPGNPRPRLFRLPEDRALLNRMGFNNDGAQVIAHRLDGARSAIPFGVNLGKSRAAELELAVEDYSESFKLLQRHGDYVAVNVSSPNTPGLRSLQERAPLTDILQALKAISPAKPVFVKVSPDLEFDALDEVIDVCLTTQCTGVIATNTTLSRDDLSSVPNEDGGISGEPLSRRSDAMLAHLGRSCGDRLILIGVGGIFTADDLYRKIALGAHLAQVYTGWVYGGPSMVPNLLRTLAERLDREGVANVAELRGTGL